MDAVVGLLDGVRARGAFVLRMMMDPPWSMSIKDEAPLTLICQTHGRAAIVGESSGTVWLGPGDVALTRGTEHYVFADDPATTPMVVIHPGQRCTTLSGDDLRFEMSLGVRTWGNSPSGATRSVICAYEGRSEVSARLLDALPTVLVLRADEWDTPLVNLLAAEAGHDGPGQEAYLDRLLDLLLIARAAHLVRPRRERPDLVARRTRPGGRPGAEADLQQSRPPVDGRESRCGRGEFARRVRQQVHRAGRRTTDRVPDQLAAGAGRRPAAVEPGHHRRGRPAGRLQHPVRVEQRVQTGLRRQPEHLPRQRRLSGWCVGLLAL